VKIRIYYEDTDAGGIVYHTNYLKYCERARSELFFSNGLVPFDGEESGFVVRRVEANFLGSAKLGDIVEVKTELVQIKRVSIALKQKILKGKKEIFNAYITLAFIKNSKPSKIPEEFLTIFKI
jgi:acyl-CoA thioester hydrolase